MRERQKAKRLEQRRARRSIRFPQGFASVFAEHCQRIAEKGRAGAEASVSRREARGEVREQLPANAHMAIEAGEMQFSARRGAMAVEDRHGGPGAVFA